MSSTTISPKLISLNASSQTNTASITRTGRSAAPQCSASAIMSGMARPLHDLQRCKPLGLARPAVLPAVRDPDGEYHRKPKRDGEGEIELRADVVESVRAAV